jgi:hypothetical protein
MCYSGDQIKKNEMVGACDTYLRGEVHTGVWWGELRARDHLENTDVDGTVILKWILKKWDGAWTGLIWLKIGKDGGLS